MDPIWASGAFNLNQICSYIPVYLTSSFLEQFWPKFPKPEYVGPIIGPVGPVVTGALWNGLCCTYLPVLVHSRAIIVQISAFYKPEYAWPIIQTVGVVSTRTSSNGLWFPCQFIKHPLETILPVKLWDRRIFFKSSIIGPVGPARAWT